MIALLLALLLPVAASAQWTPEPKDVAITRIGDDVIVTTAVPVEVMGGSIQAIVSGPITVTPGTGTWRADGSTIAVVNAAGTSLSVVGPLTDTQLRASAVPFSAASLPLPTGAATEATLSSRASESTLASIDAKVPAFPSTDRTTAAAPFSARLSDGAAFYKATTPSDTQPISAAALPLPAGAATEATLGTRASEATLASRASESTALAISTTATAIKERADLLGTESTLSTRATEATLMTRASESTQVAVSTTLAAIKDRADLLGTESTLSTRASESTLVSANTNLIAISTTVTAIKDRADLLATEATLATKASEATAVAISTTATAIKDRADLLATEATQIAISTTAAAIKARADLLATEVTAAAISTTVYAILTSSPPVTAIPTDGIIPTYSTGTISLVPAATPTDICTLTGSDSKTVRVTMVRFSATKTVEGGINVLLVKRSAANSGGTSTSSNGVSHDPNNGAGTATFRSYTANPTLGTLIGPMRAIRYGIAPTAVDAGFGLDIVTLYSADRPAKAITLRGSSHVLAVNLNGVTATGGQVNCEFEWTEE